MKITIGIPTYNQEAFIVEAVESALNQDYCDLEIVVSDDCSTDSTELLLQKYCSDKRFKYYSNKKNLGRVGNYRHLLYELATGEWYINLDGDDYFIDNTFLSRAINAINLNRSIVMVFANCVVKNEATNSMSEFTSNYNDMDKIPGLQYLYDVVNGVANPTHVTTLYNLSAARKVDFYSTDILSSDFESFFKLALYGDIIFLNNVVATWRIHGNNTVIQKSLNQSIKNLTFPHKVNILARSLDIDLNKWEVAMTLNLMGNILSEAHLNGYLIKAFYMLVKEKPWMTARLICRVDRIIRHLFYHTLKL